MRARIELVSDSDIRLSRYYNRSIQGFIYSMLNPSTAEKLHEVGHMLGKRHFKLFTFSRIFGARQSYGDYVVFQSPISIFMASSDQEFLSEVCRNALKPPIVLEGNVLRVSAIEVLKDPIFTPQITVQTLSPITAYSTLLTADGRKKTYYYSPYEQEFSSIVSANLLKKYEIITGKQTTGAVHLIPKRTRETVGVFKGTIIKGWIGTFEVSGSTELLKVGYETGFGAKNSIGYGMVAVLSARSQNQ